jgi:Beta-galactosidase
MNVKLVLLLLLLSCASFSWATFVGDEQCCWCGKPYTDIGLEQDNDVDFVVVPSMVPFTSLDQHASLLLSIVNHFENSSSSSSTSFKAYDEHGTLVASSNNISSTELLVRHSIPLRLDLLPVKNDASILACFLGELNTPVLVPVYRLTPSAADVRIDSARYGLLVRNQSFVPVGFYFDFDNDDGVQSARYVAAAAAHGINAPLAYRRAQVPSDEYIRYMDALASIGVCSQVDVHSVAQQPESAQKWHVLEQTVVALRDHPALLSWYISDEPDGNGIAPERLVEVYDFIKRLDPRHPVTLVLNCAENPAYAIARYARACDILTSDPYTVAVEQPVGCDECASGTSAALDVANRVELMRNATHYAMPFWIVLQAFGGPSEHWSRMPSPEEERAMTYVALAHGATGVIWFIEGTPPTALDAALHDASARILQLVPALLSPSPPPAAAAPQRLHVIAGGVHATARVEQNYVTVIVVNVRAEPVAYELALSPSLFAGNGNMTRSFFSVLDQRTVSTTTLNDGGALLCDMLGTLGVAVLRATTGGAASPSSSNNMLLNPSFELAHIAQLPDAWWPSSNRETATNGGSLLLDARDAYDGYVSYRVALPQTFSAYHEPKLSPGVAYELTYHAKAAEWSSPSAIVVTGKCVSSPTKALPTSEWQRFTVPLSALNATQPTRCRLIFAVSQSTSSSSSLPIIVHFDLAQVNVVSQAAAA